MIDITVSGGSLAETLSGPVMSRDRLEEVLRMIVSFEERAAELYDMLSKLTDNEPARIAFEDTAEEERVHATEFRRALSALDEEARALAQKAPVA
jgi:rubrerythrin